MKRLVYSLLIVAAILTASCGTGRRAQRSRQQSAPAVTTVQQGTIAAIIDDGQPQEEILAPMAAVLTPKVKFDYDMIEEMMSREGYYDALIERFVADDPELTIEDCVEIYYGMAFREYGPLGTVSYNIYTLSCANKYEEAYELGESALAYAPASVILLWDHYYTVRELKRPAEEIAKYRRRLNLMMAAICASGDGLTPDTAFKVHDTTSETCIWRYLFDVDFKNYKNDWDRKITCYKTHPNERYPHKKLYIDFNSPSRSDYKKTK